MTGKQCAILERNINKSVDKIKELLTDGANSGEVNNFYVEAIDNEVAKIKKELANMEY